MTYSPLSPPQEAHTGLPLWLWTLALALISGLGIREALDQSLRPLLDGLAGGGGGVAAFYLFTLLRAKLAPWLATRSGWGVGVVRYMLTAPRLARYTVLGISLAMGALAAGLTQWISGATVNSAAAAAYAFITSQLVHAERKSPIPEVPAPVDATPPEEVPDIVGLLLRAVRQYGQLPPLGRIDVETLRQLLPRLEQGGLPYYQALQALLDREGVPEDVAAYMQGSTPAE